MSEKLCTYCGELGNTRDHMIPVSYTSVRSRHNRGHNRLEDTVPCCSECNNLLGDIFLTTAETRAAYLIGALERRYRKLLDTPLWTEEELEELGPTLRSDIQNQLNNKKIVQSRLKYLNLVALGDSIT